MLLVIVLNFCVKLLCDDEVSIDGVFPGDFLDGVVSYNDGVLNVFDLNTVLMKRICDDHSIVFDFSNSVCEYIGSSCFSIAIEVLQCKVSVGSIFLKYKIVDTGYIYVYSVMW